jgi:two-component system sensor histidine kinase KdpD
MSEQFSERDGRPDPETLLRRYNLRDKDIYDTATSSPSAQEKEEGKRGRLRVYLGSVAGSGKTYAMLLEGHRRKDRGTDVVIGYVETHKRPQTEAQIGDLKIIPRAKIAYKGVTLEEMDTDAIIARHPQVVLVDELAHTNVVGSKHRKRYQDVEDILRAGIDVITTLNVQHLESLNDRVADITGVQVRETIPDRILDEADEVELIDIAPHALQQRMKHGNIYPPERIDAALENFFREGNLTALRELALRRTAEKTESQLRQYMTEHDITETWTTGERVLVGFDFRPQSRQIIRDALRLAQGLHADLLAVSIELEGPAVFLRRITGFLRYGTHAAKKHEENMQKINEYALFAEDLGAEVIRIKSEDIAHGLAQVARERNVTQIVVGQPSRRHWEEVLYGSVVNRLLRLSKTIDIHIVPTTRKRATPS